MEHKGTMRVFAEAMVIFLVVFFAMELTLRLFPSFIPYDWLLQFNADVRTAVAQQRDLQRHELTQNVSRDDGGPPLWMYKPNVTIRNQYNDPHMVDVTMDDQGFCNPDSMPYDIATIPVVVVGDSFTWCTGVSPDVTWPALVHEEINMPVYNLALPGRGPYEYLQHLKQYGLSKKPQVVIMALYEGNDLRDVDLYTRYRLGNQPAGNKDPYACGSDTLLCTWYESARTSVLGAHSYAFNALLVSIRSARAFLLERNSNDLEHVFTYSVAGGEGLIGLNIHSGDLDEITYAKKLAGNPEMLKNSVEALLTFQQLSRQEGFVPIVVYIPSAYTAYESYVIFDDPSIEPVMKSFSASQRSFYRDTVEDLGMRFVDVTPLLQTAAKDARDRESLLYFPANVHLTFRGHRAVAQALLPVILEELFPSDQHER